MPNKYLEDNPGNAYDAFADAISDFPPEYDPANGSRVALREGQRDWLVKVQECVNQMLVEHKQEITANREASSSLAALSVRMGSLASDMAGKGVSEACREATRIVSITKDISDKMARRY